MANITELQLQGDSTVHKLNDARITTTAVDTATHILTMATNSGVTSIAPITAANLASVLGGGRLLFNAFPDNKFAGIYKSWKDSGYFKITVQASSASYQRIAFQIANAYSKYEVFISTSPANYYVCRIAGDTTYNFWRVVEGDVVSIYTDMNNDTYLFDILSSPSPTTNDYHLVAVNTLPSGAELLTESSIPSFYKDYSTLADLVTGLSGEGKLTPYSVYSPLSTINITTTSELDAINGNTVVSQLRNVTGHGTYSVIVCRTFDSNWPVRFQMELVNGTNKIYVRMNWNNGTWSEWAALN